MTKYSLAPGFCVVHYTTNGHEHTMTLPVKPASSTYEPGDDPEFLQKNASTMDLDGLSDFVATLLKPLIKTTASYDGIEFYQKPNKDSDPLFINSSANSAGAGSAVSTEVAWLMWTMTFRTMKGGIFKWVTMEPVASVNVRRVAPNYSGDTAAQAILTSLIATTSPIVGRDGGYISQGLYLYTKTSDALRKKYTF